MTRLSARVACCVLISFMALGSAHAANPFGVAYKSTTNVSLYGRPTGMIVTGRCNRYDAAFADVRRRGGEVLAYLVPMSRPDHYVCALDEGFYMGDRGQVPLWPYPSYGQRSNRANTRLTDMRPGSEWILHVVSYVERLMREGKVDGVFLDSVGARPWGKSIEYGEWSTAEKNAFTDGNVDLVRRLDEKRRAIRPDFIIVNNNVWDRGDSRGLAGERYVNGVMLEQPSSVSAYYKNYVKKPFADRGKRRVIVLANSREDARRWMNVPGVTHIGAQSDAELKFPPAPVAPFENLDD